jgi:hypothetical protein
VRVLTDHIVNPANDRLKIEVLDEPGHGGACHAYVISGFDTKTNPSSGLVLRDATRLVFQNGPIAEVGVNGVTHEALLAILADRLRGFQSGRYACAENAEALKHIEAAQSVLLNRTRARMARGVEGTHKE